MGLQRRTLLRAAMLAVIAGSGGACAAQRDTVTAPSFGAPALDVPLGSIPVDTTISSVAMIGDSITVGAAAELEPMFTAGGLDVRALDAEDGRRITTGAAPRRSGVEAARTIAATDPPDLWVVALGTNDVMQYAPDEYSTVIAALLDEIPPAVPVVWVDVHLENAAEASAAFNTALDETLGARGSAIVAPWSAVAPGEGVLSDGIHPSDTGTVLFADVVGAAIALVTGR